MEKIVLSMETYEKDALLRLAKSEHRDPRVQAVLIILKDLKRRGLLTLITESEANKEKSCV